MVNDRRLRLARRVSRLAGAVVTIGGGAAVCGWTFHWPSLTTLFLGTAPIKPDAAIALICAGLALAIGDGSERRSRIARTLYAVVAGIASVTIVLYAFTETANPADGPGRMASATAFCLLAVGTSGQWRSPTLLRVGEWLTLLVIGTAGLTTIGYMYNLRTLFGLAPHAMMALGTAVLLSGLGVGTLLARADVGWTGVVLSDGLGGETSRRLLPVVVFAPIVVGWIMLQGTKTGLYGSEFALALVVVSRIAILGGVIIWTAQSLNRVDAELQESNKMLERRVEAKTLELTRANRMKSEFLAHMSHELRTPLNAIVGFTAFLRDGRAGPLNDDQREYLGDVLKSSMHLLQLVDDVLDLAKVEAGTIDIQLESVNLVRLVDEVRDVVRGLAASRNLAVTVSVEPCVATAVVDPARVKQILYNYVSNAIKFSPDGGGIQIRVVAEGPDFFRIDVEDRGLGIAEADLKRLFIEFQQLDTGAAKKYQGTGLGLALTKRVAEAHGGHVAVRSTVGRGSTFSVILPRRLKTPGMAADLQIA